MGTTTIVFITLGVIGGILLINLLIPTYKKKAHSFRELEEVEDWVLRLRNDLADDIKRLERKIRYVESINKQIMMPNIVRDVYIMDLCGNNKWEKELRKALADSNEFAVERCIRDIEKRRDIGYFVEYFIKDKVENLEKDAYLQGAREMLNMIDDIRLTKE